ncbi:MAG: hypothetical protein A3B08_01240 [Candidatus Taylorbacteria bacterium RIFCSPLOWO2_01_FULL_43_44]|uniref:Fibronectin type-III domain-containing protein n=1 Tax=Candidatus Taylorbacteria bacterium RIFCSPHIGHO2_02_FULL_43_32b TaxID=1802306 RepID=A0A1G2MN94_9BACT|nr:MAG: hypothetical protein A2743_03495 [Candidatus Taylorbacteria bacterium RIFCSPHIGHO2_01_FULL_43_47]OHA24501.1 MAG: hypothetical protein A3C72_00945 [Candidatus Taylorbacteria bacterium RIFCSPHIGHO2_02_FULL_43_32b]OHA31815.1 MAG: hypothetical protein A3B08_01240 [Candidatus Taylorbacteria bacterium RIFCSPLOWO2_01_FULL_43_44]
MNKTNKKRGFGFQVTKLVLGSVLICLCLFFVGGFADAQYTTQYINVDGVNPYEDMACVPILKGDLVVLDDDGWHSWAYSPTTYNLIPDTSSAGFVYPPDGQKYRVDFSTTATFDGTYGYPGYAWLTRNVFQSKQRIISPDELNPGAITWDMYQKSDTWITYVPNSQIYSIKYNIKFTCPNPPQYFLEASGGDPSYDYGAVDPIGVMPQVTRSTVPTTARTSSGTIGPFAVAASGVNRPGNQFYNQILSVYAGGNQYNFIFRYCIELDRQQNYDGDFIGDVYGVTTNPDQYYSPYDLNPTSACVGYPGYTPPIKRLPTNNPELTSPTAPVVDEVWPGPPQAGSSKSVNLDCTPTVVYGGSVICSWTTTGSPTSCVPSGGTGTWPTTPTPAGGGSATIPNVINDTVFAINCDGILDSSQVRVLPRPVINSVTPTYPSCVPSGQKDTATIRWNAVSLATSYNIYDSSTLIGSVASLQCVSGVCSFAHANLDPGTTHTYAVESVYGSLKARSNDYIYNVAQICIVDVSCLPLQATVTTGQAVTWDATVISGSAPYTFSWSSDGMIGTGDPWTATYTAGGIKTATVNLTANGISTGPKNCSASLTVKPVPPSTFSVTSGSSCGGSVDLVWSAVSNIDNYIISRSTSSSGPFTDVQTLSSGAVLWRDTGVSVRTSYYYRIRTVKNGVSSDPRSSGAVISSISCPTVTCPNPNPIFVNQTSFWQATPSGGTGSYTYSWSGHTQVSGKTTQSFTTLPYTVARTETAMISVTSGGFPAVATCNLVVNPIASWVYSLSVSGNISIMAGQNGSNVVTATYGSGIAEPVQFSIASISPVPSSGSLNAVFTVDDGRTCTPQPGTPCSRTLTVTPTIPVGDYTVTVNSRSMTTGVSRIANFTLSINNPPVNGSCSVSPSSIAVNSSATWSAIPGGGNGTYTYSWSDSDGHTGSLQNQPFIYNNTGQKTASVIITSNGLSSGTIVCSNSLSVGTIPFDYSIVASPNITIQAGAIDSGSNTITVTHLSGISENVSLSLSGLPRDATHLFNPASCLPNPGGSCSTAPRLTITIAPTTGAGTYPIIVHGVSSSGIPKDAPPFNLIITGAPTVDCSVSSRTIVSGSTVTWTATPRNFSSGTIVYSWTDTDGQSRAANTSNIWSPSYSTGANPKSVDATVVATLGTRTATKVCSTDLGVPVLTVNPAFDYALTLNSSAISVGINDTGSITAVLTPRYGTPVLESVGRDTTYALPTGVTISSGSCTPNLPSCTVPLTVTVSASASKGTYPIRLKGSPDDNLTNNLASFSLTITDVPTPECTLTAPTVVNPSTPFNISWTTSNSPTSCVASGAWSGTKALPSGTQSISGITLPSTYTMVCQNATLSGSCSINVAVPFDYSLGANPLTLTAPWSSTVSTARSSTITKTLVSGTPSPVSLSVSGLPPATGVPQPTATFTDQSNWCYPTCSPTMSVTIPSYTRAGTHLLTINGSPITGNNNSASVYLVITSNLQVSKNGTGSGTVTSGDGLINCGSVCSSTFTLGAAKTVILTANATSGTFSSWSGCDSTSGTTCTVTMEADKSPVATFNYIVSPFDYSLGVSQSSISIPVSSGSGSLNAVLTPVSGTASIQTITNISGAPTGITITPGAGCTPTVPCNIPINISGITATHAGTSNTITVRGSSDGNDTNNTATFVLTVPAVTTPVHTCDLLVNNSSSVRVEPGALLNFTWSTTNASLCSNGFSSDTSCNNSTSYSMLAPGPGVHTYLFNSVGVTGSSPVNCMDYVTVTVGGPTDYSISCSDLSMPPATSQDTNVGVTLESGLAAKVSINGRIAVDSRITPSFYRMWDPINGYQTGECTPFSSTPGSKCSIPVKFDTSSTLTPGTYPYTVTAVLSGTNTVLDTKTCDIVVPDFGPECDAYITAPPDYSIRQTSVTVDQGTWVNKYWSGTVIGGTAPFSAQWEEYSPDEYLNSWKVIRPWFNIVGRDVPGSFSSGGAQSSTVESRRLLVRMDSAPSIEKPAQCPTLTVNVIVPTVPLTVNKTGISPCTVFSDDGNIFCGTNCQSDNQNYPYNPSQSVFPSLVRLSVNSPMQIKFANVSNVVGYPVSGTIHQNFPLSNYNYPTKANLAIDTLSNNCVNDAGVLSSGQNWSLGAHISPNTGGTASFDANFAGQVEIDTLKLYVPYQYDGVSSCGPNNNAFMKIEVYDGPTLVFSKVGQHYNAGNNAHVIDVRVGGAPIKATTVRLTRLNSEAGYVGGLQVGEIEAWLNAPRAGASLDFKGWSGGGCSGTGICNVSMDAAKTVTADCGLIDCGYNMETISDVSVEAGSQVGTNIKVNFDHGTPQNVSFVFEGDPVATNLTNNNITINAPSCNPGTTSCTSVATINTTLSTTPGLYKVKVVSSPDCDTTTSAENVKTFNITVTPPPVPLTSINDNTFCDGGVNNLYWNESTGATSYDVIFATTASSVTIPPGGVWTSLPYISSASACSGGTCHVSHKPLLPNTKYWYQIRAVLPGNVTSPWSSLSTQISSVRCPEVICSVSPSYYGTIPVTPTWMIGGRYGDGVSYSYSYADNDSPAHTGTTPFMGSSFNLPITYMTEGLKTMKVSVTSGVYTTGPFVCPSFAARPSTQFNYSITPGLPEITITPSAPTSNIMHVKWIFGTPSAVTLQAPTVSPINNVNQSTPFTYSWVDSTCTPRTNADRECQRKPTLTLRNITTPGDYLVTVRGTTATTPPINRSTTFIVHVRAPNVGASCTVQPETVLGQSATFYGTASGGIAPLSYTWRDVASSNLRNVTSPVCREANSTITGTLTVWDSQNPPHNDTASCSTTCTIPPPVLQSATYLACSEAGVGKTLVRWTSPEGIDSFDVYRDSVKVANVLGTAGTPTATPGILFYRFRDFGLTANEWYSYYVVSKVGTYTRQSPSMDHRASKCDPLNVNCSASPSTVTITSGTPTNVNWTSIFNGSTGSFTSLTWVETDELGALTGSGSIPPNIVSPETFTRTYTEPHDYSMTMRVTAADPLDCATDPDHCSFPIDYKSKDSTPCILNVCDPNFTLSANPESVRVRQVEGVSGLPVSSESTITITPNDCFDKNIRLSLEKAVRASTGVNLTTAELNKFQMRIDGNPVNNIFDIIKENGYSVKFSVSSADSEQLIPPGVYIFTLLAEEIGSGDAERRVNVAVVVETKTPGFKEF